MPAYLFILVMLAVIWFFLIRPRQRRMREQQRQVAAIEVGDDVVTAGGLYGTVRELEDGEVRLEIAVSDDRVEPVVEAICRSARMDLPRTHGMIFVYELCDAVKVTGERGVSVI